MNYQGISLLLRPETFFLCKEKLADELLMIDDYKLLKIKVAELNTFIYCSFIMRYQKDFKDLFALNRQMILDGHSIEKLKEVAFKILDNYYDVVIDVLENNDDGMIGEVLNYINENYNDKITLKVIADELDITENYLCRLFSEKTGYRFCEYINSLRVKKAKELIEAGYDSLEYISDISGFSSQAHFSVTFKKYYGISPGKYKNKVEEEKIKKIL